MNFQLAQGRDIAFCDEQVYMAHAYQIASDGVPAAEFGPLYSFWYFVLKHIQSDPVRLYELNWQLLTVLFSCAIYAAARSVGATPVLAFLVAAALLTSQVLDVPPFINVCATAVLLAGMALAVWSRSNWFAMVGLTLLLVTYFRPEFSITFLMCLAAGVARLIYGLIRFGRIQAPWRRQVLDLAGLLALGTAAIFILGNPLGGGRIFVAFGQHYAFNVGYTEGLALDPFTNWEEIVRRDFGEGVETFREAVQRNRAAVLWHVGCNLRMLPETLVGIVRPRLGMPDWLENAVAVGILGSLVAGFALALTRRLGVCRSWRIGFFMLVLTLVTTIPAVLLVHADQRYVLPALALALPLSATGLSGFPHLRTHQLVHPARPITTMAVVVSLLAIVPNKAHGWTLQEILIGPSQARPPDVPLVNRASIVGLRKLHIHQPLVSLDANPLRPFMAGLDARPVSPWDKKSGFWEFIRQNDVNYVLIDWRLFFDHRYRHDPEFVDFAKGKNPGPFVVHFLPQADVAVAIRKDVVHDSPGP
jgi:hypothetical protein